MSLPDWAAIWTGVQPLPMGTLGSAPDFSNIFEHLSPLASSILAAICKAVSSESPPLIWTSAPLPSKIWEKNVNFT